MSQTKQDLNRKLNALINKQVIRPLLDEVEYIYIDFTPERIAGLATFYAKRAKIVKHYQAEIYKLQADALKKGSNEFLNQLHFFKKGKRYLTPIKNRKHIIIGDRKALKDFDLNKAKVDLEKLIKPELSKLKSSLNKLTAEFNASIKKRALQAGKNIPKETIKSKFLKDLRASLKEVMKKYNNSLIENAYAAGVSNSSYLGARASGARMVKKWVTRFDPKVRNYHDRVNFQTRQLHELFRVPFPGGVDHLDAPKMPPINPANYFNCRCKVAYKVIRRRS